MTREELKNYLPKNTTREWYNQIVIFHNSTYGEMVYHAKASNLKELQERIDERLKSSTYYGEVSNVQYGKIYITTETTEHREAQYVFENSCYHCEDRRI